MSFVKDYQASTIKNQLCTIFHSSNPPQDIGVTIDVFNSTIASTVFVTSQVATHQTLHHRPNEELSLIVSHF